VAQSRTRSATSDEAAEARSPATPLSPLLRVQLSSAQSTPDSGAHTAQMPQQPPPPPMAARVARAAQLSASALCAGLAGSLGAEVLLLCRLLALPPQAPAPAAAAAAAESNAASEKLRLFDGAECAWGYAATVFAACPQLLRATGERLASALADCPQLRRLAPAAAQLARSHAQQARTDALAAKRYAAAGAAGAGYRFGLALEAATEARRGAGGGGGGGVLAEQVFHNRERTRDALYALLADAAGGAQLGASVSAAGARAPTPGELAPRCRELLARLRPDNAAWLASLIAARALQAATSGETDDEVGTLVAQPERLQRLHARITAQGATSSGASDRGGIIGGVTHAMPSQPPSQAQAMPVGCGAAGGGARQLFAGPGPAQRAPPGATRPPPFGASGAAALHCAGGGSLAALFAPALRPVVLFLEAADSARLNAHLARTLTAALQELDESLGRPSAQRGDGGGGGGGGTSQGSPVASSPSGALAAAGGGGSIGAVERVLALRALGSLLGFLHFGCAAWTLPSAPALLQPPPPPLDCAAALRCAARRGALTRTLPWVLCFLRLAPWDPDSAARSPGVRDALRCVAALARSPQLAPRWGSFGAGPLCIAAAAGAFVEDTLALCCGRAHLPPGVPPPPPGGAPALRAACDGGDGCAALMAGDESDDAAPDHAPGVFDDRYVDAVCPLLADARAALLRGAAGGRWAGGGGGVEGGGGGLPQSPGGGAGTAAFPRATRRITALPPRPDGPSSSSCASSSSPGGGAGAATAAAAAAAADPVSRALHRAFWASQPELRRCADFVTDAVARACAGALAQAGARDALARAEAPLAAVLAAALLSLAAAPGAPTGPGGRPTGFDAAVERLACCAARDAAGACARQAAVAARSRGPAAFLACAGEAAPHALATAASLVAEAAAQGAAARVHSVLPPEAVEHVRRAARKRLAAAMSAAAAAAATAEVEPPADEDAGATSSASASACAWYVPPAEAWGTTAAAAAAAPLPSWTPVAAAAAVSRAAAALHVEALCCALAPLLPGEQQPGAHDAAAALRMLLALLFTPPAGAPASAQAPQALPSHLPAAAWTQLARAAVRRVADTAPGEAERAALADAVFCAQLWAPALRMCARCPELAYRVGCAFPALAHALATRRCLQAQQVDERACAWLHAAGAAGAGGRTSALRAAHTLLAGWPAEAAGGPLVQLKDAVAVE